MPLEWYTQENLIFDELGTFSMGALFLGEKLKMKMKMGCLSLGASSSL
jgi:hypothetical protein